MAALKVKTKYKDLGLPKYLQIKHTLKFKIEKGEFFAGHRLPPLKDMAKQFGVSYVTMHQAIVSLEGEGLVNSIHGKGIFVSEDLSCAPGAKMKRAKIVTRMWGEEGDYLWKVLHIIEEKLQEDGTEMILMPSHWTSTERIPDDETDCYYFIAPPAHALPGLQELAASGYRFAVIGASWEGQNDFFCVDSDNYGAARKAVEFLTASGHTRIGFIRAPFKGNTNSSDRLRGFKDALRDGGIALRDDWCSEVVWDSSPTVDEREAFNASIRSMLVSADHPTALIADGIEMATLVYRTAYANNIRIPQQSSVIGFDDNRLSLFQPPITTFCQPLEQMVDMARDYLRSIFMRKEVRKGNIFLPCTLIERASTAFLSGDIR
jgi:DNA-binding LacI/PurR family transcriptional regulator